MQLSTPFFLLCSIIAFLLSSCQQKEKPSSNATVTIAAPADAQSLDPRQSIKSLADITYAFLLYEGLARPSQNGEPALAIAEKVDVSPDLKTYTFTLKKTFWSNGEPLTAKDFEETWKSSLDPKESSPSAYQLYVIKGAKDAKEGKIPVSDVGVKALNDSTLIVELENPTPHFLKLAATMPYYPLNKSMRALFLANEQLTKENFVSNGPFKLDNWVRHHELSVVKNPRYWDTGAVKLDGVVVMVLDERTALQMFENGELGWAGSPLSAIPTDALGALKKAGQLQNAPGLGTHLLRLNTDRAPFGNAKIRRAFALAINRQELVDHVLQGNQAVALAFVPPTLWQEEPLFKDGDVTQAQQLFQEGLAEAGLTKETIPPISISYSTADERYHKIAQVIQQQWKNAFGVDVALKGGEGKVLYSSIKSRDYHVGLGSWYADSQDPISFLDVFKYKENGTNNTQWEDKRFIALLDQSALESDAANRDKTLRAAEVVLIEEMPIIPLYHGSYNFVRNPGIKGVTFSSLGFLDFKNAYIEP